MAKPFSFGANRKDAEDAGLVGGGGFYKLKEGDNRFRLMSECLPHRSTFQGKPKFKWLCYVLDRRDGEIRPFFMAHKIYKAIEALQVNEDYAFAEVPMPYDLTVHAKKAGTKDVEYTLMPARRETPLTADEIEKFDAQKPLAELKAAIDEKQQKDETPAPAHAGHVEMPKGIDGPMSDEDIPF